MQLYAIIIVVVPQKLAPISLYIYIYMCVFFGDKLSRIIQDKREREYPPCRSHAYPCDAFSTMRRGLAKHQGLAGLRCQVSSRGQYLDERSLAKMEAVG